MTGATRLDGSGYLRRDAAYSSWQGGPDFRQAFPRHLFGPHSRPERLRNVAENSPKEQRKKNRQQIHPKVKIGKNRKIA